MGQVALMGDRLVYRVLVGNLERKRQLVRRTRRWEILK
jgi:hypothetical protein